VELWQSVKKMFTNTQPAAKPQAPAQPLAPMTPEPDPEEIVVPEMTAAEVQAALAGVQPPLLLDVREQYEWNQVHIAAARHMPMNQVPNHVGELPKDRPVVVFCAHGGRSFGVAHFLREQGYDARNMTGGITQWHIAGLPVEVRRR
jgi:rhodanese-related sulfurtransferase